MEKDRRDVPGSGDGPSGLFGDGSHHARLRVARAFTGREVVIKFEGMYHGFQDYMSSPLTPRLKSVRQLPQAQSPFRLALEYRRR